MGLAGGTRLGPYEIVSPLGAGGMGEVYRGRDTRLDRSVAIKVLATELSADPELKQRFEREARAISSLQHSHICTLHDVGSQDGIDFLVMEYLEGETLAERLSRGPLKIDEALKTATEIADALDKAHRQGIVHRDLKPGNIMLTKSGTKLMDFGLAKPTAAVVGTGVIGPVTPSTPTMNLASLTSAAASPLTQKGSIVGTFQYVAPEVLQGAEADARSDLFSFGCMLYEMVTGRRAFEGQSQLSVLTAILEKEPEAVTALQPLLPPVLDHVVRTCLAKDPENRYQTARDVAIELKWIAENGSQAGGVARGAGSHDRYPRLPWVVAASALIALITTVAVIAWRSRAAAPEQLIRAYLPVPPNAQFVIRQDDIAGPVVISPDGTRVAFVAVDRAGTRGLWVEPLREGKAYMVPGTDGGIYPFWSPDSKWLGFFADGKLKKVPLDGGPVMTVADAARGRGGSWNQFDQILYAPTTQSGIFLVPVAGGKPKEVAKINSGVDDTNRWPVWLPDGKSFLYLATNHSHPEASQTNGIYVASVSGGNPRMLLPSDSNAMFAPGYLLFVQNGVLMAQTFDARAARLEGEPTPVADSIIRNSGTWRAAADVSRNGIIAYQSGPSRSAKAQLQWISPKGTAVNIGPPDNYYQVRLSPDGKRIGMIVGDPQALLAVMDLAQNSRTRLTFSGADDSFAWSPDGSQIAFGQRHAGPLNIYLKNSSGSGPEQLLYASDADQYVDDWSPDGTYLLLSAQEGNVPMLKLFVLPVKGEHKAQTFLEAPAPFNIIAAQFSPDGKWVAYVSNETGRNEVYLTNFPKPNGKWQVSTQGATEVHWEHDQKALFFLDSDGHTVLRAPIRLQGEAAEIGRAEPYVRINVDSWDTSMSFAVGRDGRVLGEDAIGDESQNITLLIHWKAALKK